MFFKNIRAWQLTKDFSQIDEVKLAELMLEQQFTPCHETQALSYGWTPPLDGEEIFFSRDDYLVFCLKIENKVMPPAAIREATLKKIDEIEKKQCHKLSRSEKQTVREEIIAEQLPKALTTSKKIYAYLDKQAGMFFVDSSAAKGSETVVGYLRETLGSFPALPLNARGTFRSIISVWIDAGEIANDSLVFEGDFEFQSLEDASTKVKFTHFEDLEKAAELLKQNFDVKKVALFYQDRITFTLDNELNIKKVKFTDIADQYLDGVDDFEDAASKFIADFIIQANFFKALFSEVMTTFKQEKPDRVEEQFEITGL